MDLFRRLLGTLQRTVDFISTFTAYLLGDGAHPGAEEAGSTRETAPRRSHPDCDVETADDGDSSPRGDRNAFEGPPIAETIPPNQEIQEASGKDSSSAQATEDIHRASELPCKDEGQEDVGQKLSEPPNSPANAPKPRSLTTGSIQQGDLEGPMVTGGLHQWEPEGSAGKGAVQQELLEEMADTKAWKPEKPLAGGQEHEELGRAGEAEGTWQKEQKETERDEQVASGGAESDGEEQRGGDGAEWTGGFQQQVANTVEDLRSEPDGELLGGANTEGNQQEEPDMEVGDEGVQPDSAESGGDQQGEPGEAEARSHPQWEPEEKVTLEVQEEDTKGVTEEEDGQQRGLEGSETEGPQPGELEGLVRNEGTQWREQGENEGDSGKESVVGEQRGDGTARTGRFQQEMAKMVESAPGGQLPGGTNMEDNQLGESDIERGDEGIQPAVPDSVESRGDQEGGPEGEAEARSHPQWEPEERVILEVQEENPKGVTGKGGGQQRGLGEAEREAHQQGELEGFVKDEGTQQREQEENKGHEQEATGGEESVMEEQRGEGTAWTGRSQQEVDKMAEGQWLEVERQLSGGAKAENDQQGEPDMETGDEGASQQSMLEGAETIGGQQGKPERDTKARSSPHWEPEEIVTLEVQEEDPKGVTGKGGGQQRGLGEAEREAHQQGELEGFVKDEGTQQREQEENKGHEQEATGGEESVMEEQRGEGTAWTGRSQQEVDKMAEGQWLEVERQLSGGAKAENDQQGEPDMETGDEVASQQSMLEGAETIGGQQGGPERDTKARSSPHWEPEEIVTLEVQEEDPKGVTGKGGGQQRGLEEAEKEESQQRELEGFLRNERTPWREQEENDGDEQEATCGEQRSGDGTAWTGGSQQEVAKMADGQWLEAEGQLAGGAKVENHQQEEPDMATGDEGSQQTILDGAERGGDQQGGQEGEAEVGRNLQWEPEETVTLEEHPEEGNGQQRGLEGAGKKGEGQQHGKLEGLVRNEAENEGPEEQMGEPGLESDQQKDPEALAGITILEEMVVAAVMEEPVFQGQEPRETEGTERSLPHEPLGDKAPIDTCCLPGAGAFPDEVPSLDTSAQKERVLLRRKSSIRRAPSLKRPRPLTESPPPQETGIEENSPPQPPPSGRPNLRHAGFGPMHPSMMAELQTRLRRPQ